MQEPQPFSRGCGSCHVWGLVHAVFLLLVDLIGSEGGLGEAVVLPPGHQRGHGGDASGHQLLHGGALDGQDGLATGAQDLVGQGQQEHRGAGDGTGGDGGCGVGLCVHSQFLSPGVAGLMWVYQSRMGRALARLYSSVPVPLPPSA